MSGIKGEKNLIRTILQAWMLAGSLDIVSALCHAYASNGTSPIRLFQYIASGVFGSTAFSGGLTMAIWGLIIHFLIAFCWTVVLFLVKRERSLALVMISAGVIVRFWLQCQVSGVFFDILRRAFTEPLHVFSYMAV